MVLSGFEEVYRDPSVYQGSEKCNIGALIVRIGIWGPVYYKYKKELPNSIGNYLGPYITASGSSAGGPPWTPQRKLHHHKLLLKPYSRKPKP